MNEFCTPKNQKMRLTRSTSFHNVSPSSLSRNKQSSSNTTCDDIHITESQLLLLCLDHLRDLRRSYSSNHDDLKIAEGIHTDYITIAIWALSRCFLRPRELCAEDKGLEEGLGTEDTNGISNTPITPPSIEKPTEHRYLYLDRPLEYGNDPYFQREYTHLALVSSSSSSGHSPSSPTVTIRASPKETNNSSHRSISIPTLEEMEREFLYSSKPHRSVEEMIQHSSPDKLEEDASEAETQNNDDKSQGTDRIHWYEYDDAHHSNVHRFYNYDGLASEPINLTQICARGLKALNARSRREAEENLMEDPIFLQYMDAVTKRGFFNVTDEDLEIAPHPLFDKNRVRRKKKENWTEMELRKYKIREIEDQRFRKVVSKFRDKIMSQVGSQKEQEQTDDTITKGKSEDDGQRTDTYVIYDKESQRENFPQKCPTSNSALHTTHLQSHHNQLTREELGDETLFTDRAQPSLPAATTPIHRVIATTPSPVSNPSGVSSPSKYSKYKEDLFDADELKARGNAQMRDGKLNEAVESYTAAITLMPGGPSSHTYFGNRAAALLSMKRFNDALDDAHRAIDLKPDYAKAHARLGLAHFLLGEYREAMEAYEEAVKLDPGNESHREYLERCRKKYLSAKAKAKALVMEHEDIERGKERQRAKNRTRSLSRNRTGKPINHVNTIDSPTSKHNYHRHLSEEEKNIDTEYSRSQHNSPHRTNRLMHNTDAIREANLLKNEGNDYMAQKQHEKAVASYSAAISLSATGPSSYLYYSNRAAALCYLERYEEAELDSERSIALQPDYGKAHSRLGLSRFYLGNYAGAVDAYETSLKYDPNNQNSRNYLTKALMKLENSRQRPQLQRKNTSVETVEVSYGSRDSIRMTPSRSHLVRERSSSRLHS